MLFLLYTLHIIVCTFLILVILLQQGSGADLSVFGGGGTQTAFGARGATQIIHRLTVWGFVGFIVLTFGIALVQGTANRSSVMSGVETADEAAEAPAEPAAEVPAVPADATPIDGGAEDTGASESSTDAQTEAPAEAAEATEAPAGDESGS